MNELSKSAAEFIQSLNGGAKAFGEELQRISPEAWRVAVYQMQIRGYRNIIFGCVISAIIFVVGLKFKQVEKKLRAANDNEAKDYYVRMWVAMCLSLLLSVASVCINIDYIINPQYGAAVKILCIIASNQSGCNTK